MDKQTLSNYGWIIITVLVLAVMLALATPFGSYVGDAVVSVANGYVGTSSNAMDEDNISNLQNKWDEKLNGGDSGETGGAGGAETPVTPTPCTHANTKIEGKVDATCTETGHTGKTVCADCSETISTGSIVTATGHTTESGTCGNCGEVVKKLITATLTYNDTMETYTITAEEGMTWGEWCESEYNTFGFYNDRIVQEFQTVMDGNGNCYPTGTILNDGNGNIECRWDCYEICDDSNGATVKANETIIANFAYWLYWD